MRSHQVHLRALQRAAEIAGGPEALAAYLGVSGDRVSIWIKGGSRIPDDVFLKIVDLLAERSLYEIDALKASGKSPGGGHSTSG